MKSLFIALFCIVSLSAFSQEIDRKPFEQSLEIFQKSINSHNGALLANKLSDQYSIGQVEGEMAKLFTQQFITECKLKISSLKIREILPEGDLFDVAAIVEIQNGKKECHFKMDKDGDFHKIDLLSGVE